MKKAIIFLVIWLVLFSLSGCQQSNRGATNNSTIGMGYSITKQPYNNDEGGNSIHIEYPLLYSEIHSMATSNDIIKDGIRQYVTDYYGAGIHNLTLELSYAVEFSEENLLSFSFRGLGNVKSAAHPNNLFFTITIGMPEQNRLKLGELYCLNADFLGIVKNNLLKQHPASVNVFNDSELSALLLQADSPTGDCFSFFTKDSLVISIPVPHALGDYMETKIKYDDIQSYLKDAS